MQWRYRHTVLLLTTLAFATTMAARLVLSPLVPDITAAFDVSTSDVGLAFTGMWAAYALAQYPGGVLANRLDERRVILIAIGAIIATITILAVAPVFGVFAVGTVLLGAAAGLPYSATTSLLSKQFDNIGRAIGIYIGGGPLAGLLVPVIATALSTTVGWRLALFVAAAVALPVFLAISWGIQQPKTDTARTGTPASAFGRSEMLNVLTRPGIAYTILLAIGGAFTWQATASFLPTFLVEHRALSQYTAGLLFAAYFVVHGLTQPLTGWLSDRVGRDRATILTMGSALVGFSILLTSPHPVAIVAAVACVGFGMSWGAPVQSRFMDQLGDAERTAGFGLVRTVYMIIGSLGSVIVGALSEHYGWTIGFGLLAALMAAEVLLLLGALAAARSR